MQALVTTNVFVPYRNRRYLLIKNYESQKSRVFQYT